MDRWQVSPNIALIIGLLTGVLGSALVTPCIVLSILKIDQVISGTVINLLAAGITDYAANVYIDPSHLSGVGVFPVLPIPVLPQIPVIGPIFFSHQPMVFLMFALVIFLQYAVFHTPWDPGCGRWRAPAQPTRLNQRQPSALHQHHPAGVWLEEPSGLESVGRFEADDPDVLSLRGHDFLPLTPVGAFGAALLFGLAGALGVRCI
jgi:simple sugar transport system permease protein